jgi:Na+/glutamate symporter
MNGTIEEDGDEVSFDGSFTGTASGETKTELSSTGGLALIGIIVAYIVGLPLLGYLIERHDFEEE